MNGRVSKAWTRRSRVKLSKALQETLLDAVGGNIAGALLQQSHQEPSPQSGGDATTVQARARKRRFDATTESDPLPVKKARSTQTDSQKPTTEDKTSEQADKFILQQPKPNPPKHPYASFLKDFVDPVHLDPYPTSVRTFVSEWLESVGSDRANYCRSDSHLHYSNGDPISRQLTRSEPNIRCTNEDADGFAMPPTPASIRSRSYRATTEDSASSTASVRHPTYRQNNLALNNIHIRDSRNQLPHYISSHVERLRANRDSPGPSSEDMARYSACLDILARGCTEADVEGFIHDAVFKNWDLRDSAGLESARSSPMSSHLVPNNLESLFRVSQPKPDLLYGYSGALEDEAFTQPQLLAQLSLHPQNARFAEATAQGLRFPFFAIQFKAAGGTRGDLWVATNQCAGASSACLNAIGQLNALLPGSKQSVDNLSYCIAVDNNTAQLYIAWKEDDLKYYLQRVDAFLLSKLEDFKSFRRQVLNILDWGKDIRLTQIKDALDTISSRRSGNEERGISSGFEVRAS